MSSIPELRGRLAAPSEPHEIEGVIPEYRRIPLSRSTHVRGWHPVRQGHPAVQFESLLERRAISALSRYPQLVSVQTQPVTVLYRRNGRTHKYTPDLLVHLSEVPAALVALGFSTKTFVEVKPKRRAIEAEEKLRRQFAVLRQATGNSVVLLTDWDLPPEETEEVRYVD